MAQSRRSAALEFFGAYFHQDWRDLYPTADDAVREYCADATAEEKIQACNEIRAVLAQRPSSEALAATMHLSWGADVYESDVDMPISGWLEHVCDLLTG